MSAKLDQSLSEIASSNRRGTGRNNRRRAARSAAVKGAPVGGVRKNTKPAKPAGKGVHNIQSAPPTESKIIVSGLPSDVNEGNIKEYFTKAAGPVKRVMLTYNQNGTSRGIASIIFSKPETAGNAAKELNGLLVDGKPMRIEVVLDAARAPDVPAPKPLTERVVQNKAQPRPATAAKKRVGRGRKARNPNRGRKTTAEDLDADMADYFQTTENGGQGEGNAQVNGAQQGGGEDLGMAEIS